MNDLDRELATAMGKHFHLPYSTDIGLCFSEVIPWIRKWPEANQRKFIRALDNLVLDRLEAQKRWDLLSQRTKLWRYPTMMLLYMTPEDICKAALASKEAA